MARTDIYTQSGVLPYRFRNSGLEILLITSRKSRRWIIPKGIVEPDLSPPESAAKEAWEEAGIQGITEEPDLGSYQIRKWGGICTVSVYPFRVTAILDDWPENFRKREWMSPANAMKRISHAGLRRLVHVFMRSQPSPE